MDEALKEANMLIIILSPDYLKSDNCTAEWTSMFSMDPAGAQRKIIPVKVEETDLKGLLKPVIYIDLVGLDEEEAKKRLLQGILEERAKPTHIPPFPGEKAKLIKPRFPGTLPRIWNIPFLRNVNFTGRSGIFQDIEISMNSEITSSHVHVIYGLSGTGKTQVLVEYSYQFSKKYEIVWWINSESFETIFIHYLKLAEILDLDLSNEEEPEKKIDTIRRWLESNGNWLLIFDNAKKPVDIINFIPRSYSGDVLISSNYPTWGDLCEKTHLTKFDREESLDFIYKKTKQDCIDESGILAESLGDLPLALAQACAYIEAKGILISKYNDLYQKYQTKLLDRSVPPDYSLSLVKTIEMSYQEIKIQSKAAADLLLLCCFFAPENISLSLIVNKSEYVQEPLKSVLSDELLLDDTLEILLNYSLIERKDDYISLHRLVQLILRDRLEESLKKQMGEITLKILCDVCPSDCADYCNWSEVAHLLPHAVAAIEITESLMIAGEIRGYLLNQLGAYFSSTGDHKVAAETFKKALESFTSACGPDNPFYATILNNHVLALRNMGDPIQLQVFVAELEKSLDANIKCFGSLSPKVSQSHTTLGLVLEAIGGKENLEKAKEHFIAAYNINNAKIEENPEWVSTDLNNIASTLQKLGGKENLMLARVFIMEALDIDLKYLDQTHPLYAVHLNNYAGILMDLGRILHQSHFIELANATLNKSYEILVESYGVEHPETKIVWENMRTFNMLLSRLNQN